MDLKKNAPKGEFLAYINKKEAAMLKKAGGSGKLVNGIPSFRPQDFGDQAKGTGAYTGGGTGGANFNASNKGGPNSVDRSRVSIEQQRKQAIAKKNKEIKDAQEAAGFYANQSVKYSKPTFASKYNDFRNYGYQKGINRNKVLAMRKMDLMKKGLPGMYGAFISGITGKVPDWAQNMTEEEIKALGADIQGIKDYNQATYNPNLNPTKKGSGSELLGRVFEGQDLVDNNSMTQTDYERLFPGNIQTTRDGNPNILPQYAMMGGGADLGGEDAVEDEYDYHLGKDGQGIGRDVTLGYLASGGRARRAEGGIMELRARRAFGGIMDRVTGRKAYGLGSIFKKVGKAAKKVLSSDIGKMAIAGAAIYYGGGGRMPFTKAFNATKGGGFGGFEMGNLFNSSNKLLFSGAADDRKFNPWKMAGLITAGGAMMGPAKVDTLPGMNNRGGSLIDPITGKEAKPAEMRASLNNALDNADGDPIRIKQINDAYAYMIPKEELGTHVPYRTYGVKDGGRIGKAEGGLMDLGGMEKDYRAEGGFVPIGEYEKKDDVPARLSVNEFVFTADAVRGAGQGDIDKGAEIMENMMVNLEKGGTVSEESQGNAGAQQMFDTSERLGEVI
mgnify:FL=1|jgi:hypothetical protein